MLLSGDYDDADDYGDDDHDEDNDNDDDENENDVLNHSSLRVRPVSQKETKANDDSIIQFPGEGQIWVTHHYHDRRHDRHRH